MVDYSVLRGLLFSVGLLHSGEAVPAHWQQSLDALDAARPTPESQPLWRAA